MTPRGKLAFLYNELLDRTICNPHLNSYEVNNSIHVYKKHYSDIETYLDKLEYLNSVFGILKTKYVQLNIVKNSNYSSYIKHCKYFGIDENVMTNDEFDLVKEMFRYE